MSLKNSNNPLKIVAIYVTTVQSPEATLMATLGSVVILQPGAVMSMGCAAARGHVEVGDPCCRLKTCWGLWSHCSLKPR